MPKKPPKSNDAAFAAEVARVLAKQRESVRRMASDMEPLSVDDLYDVSVGNVAGQGKVSASAAREKRQEFNEKMGQHAEELRRAAATAHQRGGDVLSQLTEESGLYIGALAEQERRFGNRRSARSISLSQAAEAASLQAFKQVAREFFADKVTATGYAAKPSTKPIKRSAVLLLSDLHLGAELDSLDEPMPFGAVQEARRLEYIMRQAIDYKPQYRANTELVLLLNGDLIEGQLGHQIGSGAPLTEQKAIFWMYFRRIIAEFSRAFPRVRVVCQPGNHGRDKVRHPGRATWRKWDGHEWEMYWALREMCKPLKNVAWEIPFRAVSAVDLHGQILGVSHGDTEIKLGHPDSAAAKNFRQLDAINASRLWGVHFDAWCFGHFHTGRYTLGHTRIVYNGALIPPNGHARAEGYITEACGQFLFEAVEGHIIGDVRFLEVDHRTDNDEALGKIITPFRFAADPDAAPLPRATARFRTK